MQNAKRLWRMRRSLSARVTTLETFLVVSVTSVAMLLLPASCASEKFDGVASCTGRVCGPHGEPVENYQISFGLGLSAVTGKNGMFLIPEMRAGTYTLTGMGCGWTSVRKEVRFIDRRGIVCVQVEPISAVYQRVESFLRSGLYDEAESLLRKEKPANADSRLFQFYQKVVDYCRSPSERNLRRISENLMEETDYELDYEL